MSPVEMLVAGRGPDCLGASIDAGCRTFGLTTANVLEHFDR
jgi:hypothetical protein